MKKLLGLLLLSGIIFLPMTAGASSCCDQAKSATSSPTGPAQVQPTSPEAQAAKPQVKPESAKAEQDVQKTQNAQKEKK